MSESSASESPKKDEERKHDIRFQPPMAAIVAATLLVMVGVISKAKWGDVEFSGGSPFIILAAIIVLWPILQQFVGRGGKAEILGLKIEVEKEVEKLEQRAEQDYGLKLADLRADIEELRGLLKSGATAEPTGPDSLAQANVNNFDTAVARYSASAPTLRRASRRTR